MNSNEYYRRRSQYKKKRRQAELAFFLAISVAILVIIVIVVVIVNVANRKKEDRQVDHTTEYERLYIAEQPDMTVDLLTVNPYSRCGEALTEVNNIVVHWTANPGTSAAQNRSYFEGLKDTHKTSASAHFIIGLDGEIIQCIPCNEISYASNNRNHDTISIECCTPDDTGKFNEATYDSLVKLVTWLLGRYDLTTDDVIRHYDITGKDCPKYFVNDEDAWEKFKLDMDNYIVLHGVPHESEKSTE